VEYKQVIIVRKDLNMRKGKIAAQVAHASMAVLLDSMTLSIYDKLVIEGRDMVKKDFVERRLLLEQGHPMANWLSGSFTKVCVYVESEADLLKYYTLAKAADIPTSLIKDAGRTEFDGVPTHTCVAVGPEASDQIDKITGELPLL
jgi:PTH2 family peptidyl-tRNA hydrolase